jgi:hypothetical protein
VCFFPIRCCDGVHSLLGWPVISMHAAAACVNLIHAGCMAMKKISLVCSPTSGRKEGSQFVHPVCCVSSWRYIQNAAAVLRALRPHCAAFGSFILSLFNCFIGVTALSGQHRFDQTVTQSTTIICSKRAVHVIMRAPVSGFCVWRSLVVPMQRCCHFEAARLSI